MTSLKKLNDQIIMANKRYLSKDFAEKMEKYEFHPLLKKENIIKSYEETE